MDKFELFKPDNNPCGGEGFMVDTSCTDFESQEEKKEKTFDLAKEILEWLDVLTIAIVLVVVIFSLVFRVATIDGESMQNTLFHNDRVIISNMNYQPQQGDIVVVSRNIENSIEGQSSSDAPIIKRVIAVGGQTVNIDFEKGTVYVDGVALKEAYISGPTVDKYDVNFPVFVPEGHIFVLGDNRGNSLDSRSSRIGNGGLIDNRYVLGRAIFRIFPFDKVGRLDSNE